MVITTPCVLVIVLVVRDCEVTWLPGVVVLLKSWTIDWIDKLEVIELGSSLMLLGFECLSVELVRELLSKGPVDDFAGDLDTPSIEELIISLECETMPLDFVEPVIINEEDWTLLDSETLLEMILLLRTEESDWEMNACELVADSDAEDSKSE